MKRTATTLLLLAGFGGGCASPDGAMMSKKPATPGGFGTVTRAKEIPGVQGPGGEPVGMTAVPRGATPSSSQPKTALSAIGLRPASGKKTDAAVVHAVLPGQYAAGPGVRQVNHAMDGGAGMSRGGILPVPGMGPPGAVAGVGAIVPGMQPAVTNQRTSIRFTGPAGMKVTWQLPGGGFNDEASGLTAPKEYNFLQGQVYRLRLTQVLPNFPGRTFYPTLEVSPVTPKTMTFLAHSSVPVTFTDEDFRQASEGNLVVKVIYLPDPTFQDFATVAGADEIVSTRLEPGADPVAEAQRRGTILAIIRLGNIDLENRASPAMNAPPPGMMIPPGAVMGPPRGPVGPPVPNVPPAPPPGGTPPGVSSVPPPLTPGPLPPTVGGTSGRPTTLPGVNK